MYSYKILETRLHAIRLNNSDLFTNLGISSRTNTSFVTFAFATTT